MASGSFKCKGCLKEFTRYLRIGKNNNHTFCSLECKGICKVGKSGYNFCETCKKEFHWYRSKNAALPRFCSHACQGAGVKTWRSKRGFSWKGKSEEEKFPMKKIAFFDRVEKSESCWMWTGSKTKVGYGIISFGGKPISAHRLSWLIHNGEISSDIIVRHLCNNPICVNPAHLSLGNIFDNAQDRVLSGNSGKGSKNCNSSLDEEQVKEIKNLLKIGLSGAEIGRRFGVTRTTINSIKNGRTWNHIQA